MSNTETNSIEREFTEFNRILDHSYPLCSPIQLIKKIAESNIKDGLCWAAMATYELGRVTGIREERKRRQRRAK